MEALVQSFLLVFAGEMGDKTQLLSIVLVSRYGKPWIILLGVFIATLLNHALASWGGAWASSLLEPQTLKWLLALIFMAFAIWILIPDKEERVRSSSGSSVLWFTVVTFFLAEMGDKTQLATVALGARYSDVLAVTAGTTLGMMGSNALAIFGGQWLLERVSMTWIRRIASLLFFALGVAILIGY